MPPETIYYIRKVHDMGDPYLPEFQYKGDTGMSTEEIRKFLAERDGFFCFLGKHDFAPEEEITIDHWIPLSKGGTWVLENLRLACKRCNAYKGDRMPNPDGTLPPHPKELLPVHQRRADKSGRIDYCETCASGRLLNFGEVCGVCGSGPQPATAPKHLQKEPKECDHSTYHCWMCFIGHVPRKPAIIDAVVNEG